ncbi:ATP-binding protein [Tenacibaculum maritimum]|uniref:ATP-binding protein n=1 Tax=Tenacibaculum maritimum TaxID=107401 RepID=UPI0012E50441|nr:ATP-binding protein [Tenacibaculum maritimum]MCD9563565.1 ATP-binding protein [Tenacibaculum maritimum]MCD9566730.1 ATP-binding protein [Tenacibaculum maritimum]MCD9579987.1 ATP-binding protein [Tenacibaculum maritimum]MCD9597544.1 ATP-binding protein [Tenacibaculum maritimum]MCD9614632.1 ATP-binding protein [Tenacibaculum maritimum]
MEKNQLQFKISSALKNIIGSDLINDDFIAVFELVKNSYDAHATKVEITFENIYSENAKIIIKDNGKGMNYDDLINKWLFVAYSAKKEGTEEDSYDYRGKIKVKRAYAGAKGIGRFSCDRLGAELYLETVKDEPKAKVETLLTEWDKFEGDLKEEFVNISVLHETIQKKNQTNGTTLEISKLKSDWNRDKFLKLKDALAKLINPNTQSKEDEFEIYLNVDEEKDEDTDNNEYRLIVNGQIQNLIFDTLEIKTTKIVSSIKNDKIITSLTEGGKLVYQIIESNTYLFLNNIEFNLYHLNRSSKSIFSRRMGITPVEYGHVFVYKNGLRIYPYGNRGEDPFKMDNRKAQGHSRYLGTRDVLGYVSIFEPNDLLKETSSRGDGLSKTEAYFELVDWYYSTLKKLEKYIIDITDWGNDLSNEDYIKLNERNKQLALEKLVSNLTKSKNLISFEVAPEIFEIIDKKQEKSTKSTLTKIKKQIESGTFDKKEVVSSLSKLEKDVDTLKKTTEEATEEALDSLIKNEELESNLETEKKKGLFQGALIGTDKERIIGMQHQIYHSSSRISRSLKLLLKHVGTDKLDEKTQKYIKIISLESSKIKSIANFVTKANFNLKASEITADIIGFIKDYINEIYLIDNRIIDINIKINFLDKFKKEYVKEFRPLELTTIFDNIISNSEKAGANEISILFKKNQDKLNIEIEDNGKGIPKQNINDVFKMGYTTTKGSGIGLFQVHDLVTDEKKLNGEISISSIENKGTNIKITI